MHGFFGRKRLVLSTGTVRRFEIADIRALISGGDGNRWDVKMELVLISDLN